VNPLYEQRATGEANREEQDAADSAAGRGHAAGGAGDGAGPAVQLVNPYATGSTTDLLTRALATGLQARLLARIEIGK
jgi:tripartite-type tricarboxylate transporter receptor subunit TctC